MKPGTINLPEDRYFDPDPRQKELAQHLYSQVANLPLICPHGHVDPRMFADPDYSFGSPVDLLIIPDHYVFRMLYSQGIPLEKLGLPRRDGGPVEQDHRRIWQVFAENFYLFRGTPTGVWLAHELQDVFGAQEKLKLQKIKARVVSAAREMTDHDCAMESMRHSSLAIDPSAVPSSK